MGKHFLLGATGAAVMFVFYLAVLWLANSPAHVIEQLTWYWYLIFPLVILTGIQVGLYSFIREKAALAALSGTGIAATGGMSAGSMVACCIHHLLDIFPILGLAGAALFLSRYQSTFMAIGILSGMIGVFHMLEIIKKNKMALSSGPAIKINFVFLRNLAIILAIVVLAFLLFSMSQTK